MGWLRAMSKDVWKEFEDNLIMSFGTAIHETVQLYLKVLYGKGDKDAARIDLMKYFKWAFKKEVAKKKIPHKKTIYVMPYFTHSSIPMDG